MVVLLFLEPMRPSLVDSPLLEPCPHQALHPVKRKIAPKRLSGFSEVLESVSA